jgi:hypothetical protein
MPIKPVLSPETLNDLMPIFLKSLNTIYSSKAKLSDMGNYDRTAEEEDRIIFYKKENETDSMFKFIHHHYLTPNNHHVSFQKFDMDLDLYMNNILNLCSVYSEHSYFFVDTRLYLDRISNSWLLNKLFPPKVANDNIKIELELHFNQYLIAGDFYLSCECINGVMIIQNKKDVHPFFEKITNNFKERFNIPDEINLDYTQTEANFKESILLLHMATI